jgi:hypothetical protein
MTLFSRLALCAVAIASAAFFSSGAKAQSYDLNVKGGSGAQIENGKQYWVTIKCTSGDGKKRTASSPDVFSTPKAYLQRLNAKGEYRPTPYGWGKQAKAASLWISIGSENLNITNGTPSIATSSIGSGNSGIDSIFIPVYVLGIGSGPDFVKRNDSDCSRTFMVAGRSSETLVVNATFTSKAGWDYETDADPVAAVFDFADEVLKQTGKFITGTSLIKELPRFLFDIDKEEETAEFIAERGEAASGFAAAWIKLAKTFGDEGFFNEDMTLRVGKNVVENGYARVEINVREVASFVLSKAPFTTTLETKGSSFWPLETNGQPKVTEFFQNRTKINFPGQLDHDKYSSFVGECDRYVQDLNRKGLTSKIDQAYVLARLLASDSLSRFATMRCFHAFNELRSQISVLRSQKYIWNRFSRPNETLFSVSAYDVARPQLERESNPLAPEGKGKPDPLATEAKRALADFSPAFNVSGKLLGLDQTLIVHDAAGVLNLASDAITDPKALAEAFRTSGYNRANCFFVNNPENVVKLGEEYFAGDVDGVFLFHRLPSVTELAGNVYRPSLAVLTQVTINPLTKKIWRFVTSELDPEPLFSGTNVCKRKQATTRVFATNLKGMLGNAQGLFVLNQSLGNKLREFQESVAEHVEILDPSGLVLTEADVDQRNVRMTRDEAFAAVARAGFRGFSCGLEANNRGNVPKYYFGGRSALFVLHRNRFAPSSADATIVLVDGDTDKKVALLEVVSPLDLDPSVILNEISDCGIPKPAGG